MTLLLLTQQHVVDSFLGRWITVYFSCSKAVCVALSPFTNQSPVDGQYFQTPFHKPQGGCPQHSFVQWPQDKDTYSLGVLIWQLTGQQSGWSGGREGRERPTALLRIS